MPPRARTAVIALACAFTQLFATAHFVLVRHAICLEHGHAVDVDHDSRAHARLAPASRETSIAATSSDALHASEHEHCATACDPRSRAIGASRSALVRIAVASRVVSPPEARAPAAFPIAILMLAPKSSPPARRS